MVSTLTSVMGMPTSGWLAKHVCMRFSIVDIWQTNIEMASDSSFTSPFHNNTTPARWQPSNFYFSKLKVSGRGRSNAESDSDVSSEKLDIIISQLSEQKQSLEDEREN